MKAVASKELIAVDALRVGMFVHLDMGWMSHPFPLGSFKIASAEQIATIRSLGVRQVRWNPEHSDVTEPAERGVSPRSGAPDRAGAAAAPAAQGGTAAAAEAAACRVPIAPGAATAATAAAATTAVPAATASAAAATTDASAGLAGSPALAGLGARRDHQRRLADQRAALALCERQFAEAAQGCQHVTDLVAHRPQEARVQAERLSQALVHKMLGEQELCIRLLADAAGDKASTHALNVTVIALLMGRTFGLTPADMLDLGVGAMLHDIG